jgi:trimeric autotransporter adhesin
MVRRSILSTSILLTMTCAIIALCGCGGKNGLLGNGGGASLTAVSLTPTNPTLTLSLSPPATKQFVAIGQYSFGNPKDITNQLTWVSADTTVATIDNKGVAKAVGSGKVIITGSIQDPVSLKLFQVSTVVTVVPQLTGISISPASAQIAKGTAQQFTATAKYNDGTSPDITSLVTWNSTQSATATVSSSPGTQGLALAVSPGSTSISASLGMVSSSVSALTVSNANLVSISLTPAGATVPLATSQQFVANGSFDDGTQQNISETANWTSSSPTIAHVSSVGVVTGAGLGTTTITARSGAVNGTTSATVDASSVAALNILIAGLPDGKIADLTNYQMRAVAVFKDSSSLDVTHTPGITWNSSSPAVASIGGSTGLALAVGPGTATISASLGQSGSTSLTVSDSTIRALAVGPSNSTIAAGTAQNMIAVGTFFDTSGTFQQDISSASAWASDNTGVATVAYANGLQELATGVARGTANVSASFADAHGNLATVSAPLNVSNAHLSGISIAPGSASITSGGGRQYVATGVFTDGTQQDLTTIADWSATNGAVATVSSFGYAAAVGPGQTSVSATLNSQTGSSSLLVNPGALTRIDICAATVSNPLPNCPPLDPVTPPPPISFAKQVPYGLIAIGTFADGSRQDLTSSVQWSSGSAAVATISDDPGIPGYVTGVTGQGVVTGLAAGTVKITATAGGVSGVASVIVTAATPQFMTVTPADAAVTLGLGQSFTATVTFSDSTTQIATPYVQWTTSNPAIAVVTRGGFAYSTGKGTANIFASLDGIYGPTTLTVQ